MKSSILKSLALSGLLALSSQGFSFFDDAPAIGIPESHAMRYSVYMSAGYDSNINATNRANREDGGFVKYGVTAKYADFESATKKTLDARLGGQLYNKTANGTDDRNFSDISVRGTVSHAFSAGSQYAGSFSVTYTPEPDYSSGYSSIDNQGDCLTWHIGNSYSRMIDCRWSWTANVDYSGNVYSEGYYEHDDREYLNAGLSLNLRADSRTTYGLNGTWRREMREQGFNSTSWFANLSIAHSLSPTDSISFRVGTQVKVIDSNCDLYPTLSASYRRVLTEGLSANAYVSFSNENIDTFIRQGSRNYLSNEAWRAGVNLSYAYTPTVTFSLGAAMLYSDYSKGTNGAPDYDRERFSITAGMSYRITTNLTGSLTYSYTYCDNGEISVIDHYNRDVISAGLNYSF